MKVTLILPSIGKKENAKYVRTWQMEPLQIATLAGITPDDVEVQFFDDRFCVIDFDEETDLVAISVETYTAKRAYEISKEYQKRGVPVLLGGYHVMLVPQEAQQYADSILVGYAEGVWSKILKDVGQGKLQSHYEGKKLCDIVFSLPNRSIFDGHKYIKMHCVETSRGCPFHCNFCSIMSATKSTFVTRPIDLVVQDVASLSGRNIFFVDDNIVGNLARTKDLLRELIPLKISWFSQGSLHMAYDDELMQLMVDSGCVGVLIGFESLNKKSLHLMKKQFLTKMQNVNSLVRRIHSYGIGIYGTFIFGYDTDCIGDIDIAVEKAIEWQLFIAAFNHLVPFPGTPLYNELHHDGRMINDAWWLDSSFRFNDVPFYPKQMGRGQLRQACIDARKKFYSYSSIFQRCKNYSGNLKGIKKAASYVLINKMLQKEVDEKDGLPLGFSRS